eukprot:TRINITY_DN4803_c0_g1_i2.p2 TRINITY_DN4803_c0_g1~~TRINITY_DN4803_c0_g1_i2.p2  ORF type:complete len:134 (+),score=37.29 TRINITY_DN4803_c0_g1_i2:88-489(+)
MCIRDSFNTFEALSPGRWDRPDYYDRGAQYRSVVGIPGGTQGGLYSLLVAANAASKNMSLVEGKAGDGDTLLLNRVLVYDSDDNKFPFHQAELCLQFHDDATQKYNASYHALRPVLQREGRVVDTHCPKNYVC